MASAQAGRSHEQVARLLRRAGYSEEFNREVLSQLPDPVVRERDEEILARYGLTTQNG
jgi:hypothetical protein